MPNFHHGSNRKPLTRKPNYLLILVSSNTESSVETDFSGTTFTCAIIRDNSCIMANIGDSRTSLGYRNAQGGITAVSLTIDHKPDLPAEKV